MARVITVIIVILICLIAIGFYYKYFGFSTQKSDGKSKISLTIDNEKIEHDEKAAIEKAKDLGK